MDKQQLAHQTEALTRRERKVLQQLATGRTNREIGEAFSISLHTVKWYVKQIFRKLQVQRRTEAVAVARSLGLLEEPAKFTLASEAPAASDLPTFVGREQELAQLDQVLHKTLAGQSQIVFVTGEAGSGKSALVQAFVRRAQTRYPRLIAVGGQCNAFTGIGDPYLPFGEILTLLTGDTEGRRHAHALEPMQRDRLTALLPESVQALVEQGPTLLTTLLDGHALLTRIEQSQIGSRSWRAQIKTQIKHVIRTPAGGLTQQRLFAEMTAVLQALAQQRPLHLVLDDLQWADLGSLNLLFHLSRELVDVPLLIIGIYRNSDVALGRNGERHPLLAVVNELQRRFGEQRMDLGQTGTPAFVDALLETLPNRFTPEFRQAFYQQTRGHALFSVEMLRGLQERGDLVQDEEGRWVTTPQLDWSLLPARVEGILRERIERLSSADQRLLQLACVEGETFSAQTIAGIQQQELPTVIHQLSGVLDRQHRLVAVETDREHTSRSIARYRFRHILFQQFAYQQLDTFERQQAHAVVAQALETLHYERAAEMAVSLAYHFQQGGVLEKAVDYLLLAGQRANQMVAHAEALIHLTRGLNLLQDLPETSARYHQELEFHLAAGPAHRVVNGYRSPELEATFRRAQELCARLGDPPEFFPALWGILPYYWVLPDLATAYGLAQRCLAIAQSQPDTDRRLAVHRALGAILYIRGDFAESNHHLATGIALYRAQNEQTNVALYGFDNGICCLYYHSWLLWLRGYPDQALAQILATRQAAAQSKHPFDMVVLVFEWYIRFYRGEVAEALAAAETLVEMARAQNVASWPAYGTIQRGAALAELGELEQGIALMQEGIAGMRADHIEMTQPLFLTLLANAYLQQGDVIRGLQAVDEALERIAATDECHTEAESLRVRGELLLQRHVQDGDPDADQEAAEACFQQALQIARHQQAKSLELRIAMSLSRLWLVQNQANEARELLDPIYGWFTEGHEIMDLQTANSLLAELRTTS